MLFKRITALTVAAAAAVTVTACSVDLSSTAEESRTVMTVDGWEVPYEMYRYAAMMHLRDQAEIILADAEKPAETAETVAGETTAADSTAVTDEPLSANEMIAEAVAMLSDEEKTALAEDVEEYSVETIANIYSIFTAAKEKGIDPFGETVNSMTDMEMEEIRATYGSDQDYLDTIKLFFMNDSVYSVLTRYELVFNQLYEIYVRDGVIDTSDEAVIEYMNSDDAVRVKQILISFERHTEEEALRIAGDVHGKLSKYVDENGKVDEDKFDEFTDDYGEDLFMFKNRDGYYIPRGYTDEAFEEAAFALEIGTLSGIVRTSAGYSIMMRAEKDPGFIKEKLDTLKDTCVAGIYRTMLDEFSASAKIEKNDEFARIDIFSMK